MYNIKQTKEIAEREGFEIKKGITMFGPSLYAVRYTAENEGYTATFRFDNHQMGNKGKLLEVIWVVYFPIFDMDRKRLANGGLGKEFRAAKEISRLFNDVDVRCCGVSSALFKNGKFVGKL